MPGRPKSLALNKTLTALVLFMAFLVGFALVSIAAHSIIFSADRFVGETLFVRAKLAAEHRADVVFVGPSHIENGVNPDVFDAELSKYVKVHSVNSAWGGTGVLELEFLLEKIFASNPCCVKYVIFYPAFHLTDLARTSGTTRAIDYFSFSRAVRYWSYLEELDPLPVPPIPRFEYAKNIILSVLRRYSNIGLGLKLIGWKPGRPTKGSPTADGFIRNGPRGHTILTTAMSDDLYNFWLYEIEEYKKQRPQFRRQIVTDRMFSAVVSIVDLIGRHGAKAIIVRPPAIEHWQWDLAFTRKYKEECPNGPPLLEFDLESAPELYERANFYNSSHLTDRGAKLWSRMLADRVGKLIRSGRLDEPSFCDARSQ
jgi:hypothetical protein